MTKDIAQTLTRSHTGLMALNNNTVLHCANMTKQNLSQNQQSAHFQIKHEIQTLKTVQVMKAAEIF